MYIYLYENPYILLCQKLYKQSYLLHYVLNLRPFSVIEV